MKELHEPVWVIFDGGNSLWKYHFIWVEKGKFMTGELPPLPHAIVRDDEGTRFNAVKSRYSRVAGNGDNEWFGVDGSYFAVGRSAESDALVIRKTGAEKYTRDYMGIALMAGLLSTLKDGHNNLHVYASFPSGDVNSVGALINSLIGKWTVETSGTNTIQYRIRSVQPYDEPLGAYVNAMSDVDGRPYKAHHLEKGSTLVIDIGGKISNVLRVLEGGRVQYGSAQSIDVGMQNVTEEFIRLLKVDYPVLNKMRSFDERIVRAAIATGQYEYKGAFLDCAKAVHGATMTILNRLNTYYVNNFAGGANDRNILVTGGGGGAMYSHLQTALDHKRMFRAEDAENMHLANVRGGSRLCRAAILKERGGRL